MHTPTLPDLKLWDIKPDRYTRKQVALDQSGMPWYASTIASRFYTQTMGFNLTQQKLKKQISRKQGFQKWLIVIWRLVQA